MGNIDVLKLRSKFSALANEKRLRIIELCLQKPRTITELSKLLKLNYSITVEYTGMLEKAGFVSKTRNENKTVSVKSLFRINNFGEVKKI